MFGANVAVAPWLLVTVRGWARRDHLRRRLQVRRLQVRRLQGLADRITPGQLLDIAVHQLGEEGVVARRRRRLVGRSGVEAGAGQDRRQRRRPEPLQELQGDPRMAAVAERAAGIGEPEFQKPIWRTPCAMKKSSAEASPCISLPRPPMPYSGIARGRSP